MMVVGLHSNVKDKKRHNILALKAMLRTLAIFK
jgi:hypothetical protein